MTLSNPVSPDEPAGPSADRDNPPADHTEVRPHGAEWFVLGPPECRVRGRSAPTGPARQRALACLLLAEAGGIVSMPTIINALWPAGPPDRAVNMVHRMVGGLRRIVQPDLPRRDQGSWLYSDGGGYRVGLEAGSLDVLRFRDLLNQARAADDPRHRLESALAALGQWRGQVAEGLPAELRAHAVFDGLDREHADAALWVLEDALTAGLASRLLPALTQAGRAFPTDELIQAALMRCLASSGQRARALTLFHRLRTDLADELGVDPGPALQATHLAVLRDDMTASDLVRPLPVPAQLPIRAVDFVGRQDELDRLARYCGPDSNGRPIVITGPPGIGKTTLAVELAHQVAPYFPDGQLFVELHGLERSPSIWPDAVLLRFLESFDVPASKIPKDIGARAALYRSMVADRRVLVVLDGAPDSDRLRHLLPGEADCRIILTCRRAPRALLDGGVQLVRLSNLATDEALQFLRDRLEAERLVDDAGVRAIAAASKGRPLALALIASRANRAPELSPSEIAAAGRVGRSRPPSQHPVPTDRRPPESGDDPLWLDAWTLLRRLSLYPAPTITARHAAAILDSSQTHAQVCLDRPKESALVVEETPGRYAWHHLVDRMVREMAEVVDDAELRAASSRLYQQTAADALATACSLFARPMLAGDSPPAKPSAGATEAECWFESEWPLLVAMVERARHTPEFDRHVWTIAWSIGPYLDGHGLWSELQATTEVARRSADRSGSALVRGQLRVQGARAAANHGEYADAEFLSREAVQLLTSSPATPPEPLAETLRQLAWNCEQLGDIQEALANSRRALELLDDQDHQSDTHLGLALNAVGWYEALSGDWSRKPGNSPA